MTTGYSTTEVLAELRRAVDEAGGVRPFARRHGVSATYVSKATRGEMTIGDKLAAAIGLTPVTVFVERLRAKGK